LTKKKDGSFERGKIAVLDKGGKLLKGTVAISAEKIG